MNLDAQFYMAKIAKIKERTDQLLEIHNDKYNDIYDFIINSSDPKTSDLKKHFEENKNKQHSGEQPISTDKYKPIHIQKIYKDCAFLLHPDKPTGSTADFQLLKQAYDNDDIYTIIKIVLDNDLPIEIPPNVVKSLKHQYEKAQQNKRNLKINWTNQWNKEWTYEEKLAFIEKLYIL